MPRFGMVSVVAHPETSDALASLQSIAGVPYAVKADAIVTF